MSNGVNNNSVENKVWLNAKSRYDMNWHIYGHMHEINLLGVSFFSQFFFSMRYPVRHPDGSRYTYLVLQLNKFTCRCFVPFFGILQLLLQIMYIQCSSCVRFYVLFIYQFFIARACRSLQTFINESRRVKRLLSEGDAREVKREERLRRAIIFFL